MSDENVIDYFYLKGKCMDTKDLLIQFLLEKLETTPAGEARGSSPVGKICMVRTYSAGVFYGLLAQLNGKEGTIRNARRVWYWEGAASLSQLAKEGTSAASKCRFPCSVDEVFLTEIIEVIPMTNEAIKSLDGVPEWKK